MDLSLIKLAIETGKAAVTDIMTLTAQNDLADNGTISAMRETTTTIRLQMVISLGLEHIAPSPEGVLFLVDSSKSAIAQAEYAEARWREYAGEVYNYLDAYERLKPSAEALNNLKQANEFVAMLEGAAKALVAANARAYLEAHPQPGTGLGDVVIMAPEWARQLQADVTEILAWVRSQQGTGQPPVVAIEGVVGAFVRYLPWHSTAGVTGMYGNSGQPGKVIAAWQYDALFKAVQTGKALTVSTTEKGVRIHLTPQPPDHCYWISVGVAEIPTGALEVIVSDLDVAGNRVVQRLHV